MNILTFKEYEDMKMKTLHEANDWKTETSPMDEYGQYYKTYICDNDTVITEVIRPFYETVDVEVKGIRTQVQVKLLESEMFSNKFSSVYMYEEF